MGLLDWLTDLGGSDMMGNLAASGGAGSTMPPPSPGMQPPVQPPTPPVQPQPSPPMPPVQGLDSSGPSQVQMLGQDAPPLPPGQQGTPPVPLPRPRPAAADAAPPMPPQPSPDALPPNAQPTAGGLDVPGAVRSYQAAGGSLTPPPTPMPGQQGGGAGAGGGGLLSRVLGLSDSTASKIRSGLGAGLKAAGNSAGKSPFQALASGAGEGMQGQDARSDKEYDQKIKYLQASVAAKAAGDKSAYNENYAKYLSGKLKLDTDKAASGDAGGKKSSAWNKPDSQKFIDAQHAVAADPEIHASQKLLEQTAKTGEPADIAKAQAAHTALIQKKQAEYLAGVGLNPQQIQKNMQSPPGTRPNPHIVTSQQDFDQYVKPGDSYVNPKDGKVYIRKGGGNSSGSESPAAAPTAPAAPPSPIEPPGPMPGTKTDDEN